MLTTYLLIALFSAWFAEISELPQFLMKWLMYRYKIFKRVQMGEIVTERPYRIKPFDCELCLSWWIALITSLAVYHFSFFYSILISGSCSLIAMVIVKLYRKYL